MVRQIDVLDDSGARIGAVGQARRGRRDWFIAGSYSGGWYRSQADATAELRARHANMAAWRSGAMSHDEMMRQARERERARGNAAAVNDYAGDGLDSRYEDDCAAICGR